MTSLHMRKVCVLLAIEAVFACEITARGDLAECVDPFVGTTGTGHTSPAACCPFGMVQPGPDTGNGDWGHCSGWGLYDMHGNAEEIVADLHSAVSGWKGYTTAKGIYLNTDETALTDDTKSTDGVAKCVKKGGGYNSSASSCRSASRSHYNRHKAQNSGMTKGVRQVCSYGL